MQYHVFLDANILLDFYKLQPTIIKKLDEHIKFNKFKPVLTSHVIGEYKRNRSRVLDEIFENNQLFTTRLKPKNCDESFFNDLENFQVIRDEANKYNNLLQDFIKQFEKHKKEKTFTADAFVEK
jgi:rRNA-processing protein FCF1